MKLSAPIHVLKSKAKDLKKSKAMTMTEALDEVAKSEGYSSWSLLQAKAKDILPQTKEDILNYLNPGDLMLIASRPGLGKTTFTLQLLVQAMKEKRRSYFFSLEYTHKDVASKVADLDETIGHQNPYLSFDFSDDISSQYIMNKTKDHISQGMIIAVDYLQLLDQQRTKPELQTQVQELKEFAKEKECTIIFISQVDRSVETEPKMTPRLEDIRLPNPVDLKLFNKVMFIHNRKKIFIKPVPFELE